VRTAQAFPWMESPAAFFIFLTTVDLSEVN
jgi:hypothetical protein